MRLALRAPEGPPPGEYSVAPFLRWAGSKRKILSRLGALWSSHHQRYVEPFAGSACLFFWLAPPKAVLGDNNDALVATFNAVKDNPDALHRRLVAIPRNEKTYYRWRALNPQTLDAETRAVRFLFLNRNCFNGIYRTNAKGEFNVPFGGKRIGSNIAKAELRKCADLLSRAELISGDFGTTLQSVKKGDFVYLDPPFALESRRMFREYGTEAFSTGDVPRLTIELSRIVERGADFLLSYADCREARSLAAQWHSKRVVVRRHIAGFAGDRAVAYEWMISNMPLGGKN